MRRFRAPLFAILALALTACAGPDRLVFAPVVADGMYAADPLAGSFLRAQGRPAPRALPPVHQPESLLSAPGDGPSPD